MDDEVRVEGVSLDAGVPAILREDDHGVRIAVDLDQDPKDVVRALSALLTERFTSGAWKRSPGEP